MEKVGDESAFLKQVLNLIEAQFGDVCEVVLHDLSGDYDHTIVDIRNGDITGRKIGGSGTNLGLEVLSGKVEDGDRFNYVTTTSNGKILRSSSIYIKNSEGKVIGSICVNLDITDSLHFEGFLHKYNHFESEKSEFFAQDVGSLLDYMIDQEIKRLGKMPADFNRDERFDFIASLDRQGAFQISKSGIKVCEILGISKFTLYNNLESIRGGKEKSE
jgi:predicted transcriptional regulator YheO